MFQRLRHRRRLCSRHLAFGLFRFDPALNALMFICGSPLSNFTIMPLRNSLRAQVIKQFIEFRPLTNTQATCESYMHVVQGSLIIGYRVPPQGKSEAVPPTRMDDHKRTIVSTPNCDELESAKLPSELCLTALPPHCELGSHFLLDLLLNEFPILFISAAFPFCIEGGLELCLKEFVQLFRQGQTHVENVLREDGNLTFAWFHFLFPNLISASPLRPKAKRIPVNFGLGGMKMPPHRSPSSPSSTSSLDNRRQEIATLLALGFARLVARSDLPLDTKSSTGLLPPNERVSVSESGQ